jgi:hypothetical protein
MERRALEEERDDKIAQLVAERDMWKRSAETHMNSTARYAGLAQAVRICQRLLDEATTKTGDGSIDAQLYWATYRDAIKAVLGQLKLEHHISKHNADNEVVVPREPSEGAIDKGLASTAIHLDIVGSQLTINREKMRHRWMAMVDYYRDGGGE